MEEERQSAIAVRLLLRGADLHDNRFAGSDCRVKGTPLPPVTILAIQAKPRASLRANAGAARAARSPAATGSA